MSKINAFERSICRLCKANGLMPPKKELLQFGYSRLRIDVSSWEQYSLAVRLLQRRGNTVLVKQLANSDGGYFEGVVCVMEKAEHERCSTMLAERAQKLEDWWQRYHAADDETRRLMACGAVS